MQKIQKKYKGLSNIGATCYMNSLLQTLFMTPEFRYTIYKWKYNQKIHPKQEDSIIFQLQKLFGKLQVDFPYQVTTKQLVKSFQWQDQQVQMQQDIQQFNRLLFQALQKSILTKSQKYIHTKFVKQYFQGQLINYTKCYECQNQSVREQFFQDVIVTVKNIYQKVYNGSLQLGIQRYLKPQILDQNNLYECSKCNKKTKAQRGTRFIKMPKLLNIILQRFNFNFFTMERQKINDRVQFPFVLNFNDYIQGYDKIPDKLNEDSSQYFKTTNIPKPPIKKPFQSKPMSNGVKKKPVSSAPSIAGKTTIKPSANTKSFLAQMRKKKNIQQQNQDLFFVSGSGTASQNTSTNSANSIKPALSQNNIKAQNNKIQPEISKQSINKQINGDLNKIIQQNNQIPNNLPVPPPLLILPQQPSQPYINSLQNQNKSDSLAPKTIQSQLQQKLLQKQNMNKQKQQKLLQLQIKNKELVEKYLKEGPLVYELYAVLVHNGTANHGHYYAYIKSFQNQKWYCFNDQKVNQINVLEIQKTFGNLNSNAYALYYRMVQSQNQIQINQNQLFLLKEQIPEYIKKKIQFQIQQFTQKQKMKFQNLENVIVLKIYYQLYCKQIQVYKSNNLQLVLKKARQILNISENQIKNQNMRLRLFNPVNQNKLETFGGRQKKSLEELKIGSYKSLLLQVKKDNQIFEEYQIGSIALRIAFLEQNKNLNSLDQTYLKLHKIIIKHSSTIKDVLNVIQTKRKQIFNQNNKTSKLCLIKRHQNNDETIHQIISNKQNENRNLQDLMILQNEILFVQPFLEESKLMWPIQFENQIYRISIKYNKPPGSTHFQNYLTDSRLTVEQLKNQLCIFLDMNPQDLIMKWGTKSGRQLKDMSLTLKQSRFITGTQVYFELGIPAKTGQIRIQLYLARDTSVDNFSRIHQFQYLTDVPISGAAKASQVKQRFIKVLSKLKNIQLNPQQFRIRQRVSDKIGKIYRQRPMRQQQLIQKRQIAIQLVPQQNLDIKQFLIYFRIWDQNNWKLSKKIQVLVNKLTSMKQLIEILVTNQQNKNILKDTNQISICRILSIHKFNIIDLTAMQWFDMNQDMPMIGQPMFVNTDGLLYIVKNSNQQPRELTKEQELKFGGCVKPSIIRNGVKSSSYKCKQAKGMKIKVIEKLQQQSQQINGQMIEQKNEQKNEQKK